MWRRLINTILVLRKKPTAVTNVVKPSSEMSRLSVRCIEGEERMQLTFTYAHSDIETAAPPTAPAKCNTQNPNTNWKIKSRLYTLNRLQDESLNVTLDRIVANVSKYVHRRKRCRGGSAESSPELVAPVTATLYTRADAETVSSLPNSVAWSDGSTLRISDTAFRVRVNPPRIVSVTLPARPLAGCAVYPWLQLEFCERPACRFTWARRAPGPGPWCDVGDGFLYQPADADVGCRLKLTCAPPGGSDGDDVSTEAAECVAASPTHFPFERRHKHTEQPSGPGRMRVVCYNILADLYADSDFSRSVLFPYCPADLLDHSYRRQILLRELTGYNADLICLQEVDTKLFDNDLTTVLGGQGFKGHLKLKKLGQVAEGTAIFYRESKFRFVSRHDINLVETLQEDPHFSALYQQICANDALKCKVLERNTALQVTVLEPSEGATRRLVVATTHLYFHPEAGHIRLLQTHVCLNHLQRVRLHHEQLGYECSVLFCGDFNSCPEVGVHQLIVDGSIPSSHSDWSAGGPGELVETFSLRHDLPQLASAIWPPPRYTNYTQSFDGCLDYIYVEAGRLATVSVVPLPSDEEVRENVALPSRVFPSDHLAIVCDLQWKGAT